MQEVGIATKCYRTKRDLKEAKLVSNYGQFKIACHIETKVNLMISLEYNFGLVWVCSQFKVHFVPHM